MQKNQDAKPGNSWTLPFRYLASCCVDLFIVYVCTYLFFVHIAVLVFVPVFPTVNYGLAPFLVWLAVVVVYEVVAFVLRRRNERAHAWAERLFFGFFAVVGALCLLMISRLSLFNVPYPKILAVGALLLAIVGARYLIGRSACRKAAVFVAILLTFAFAVLRVSRYLVSFEDLLPVNEKGVRVVQNLSTLEAPDERDPAGESLHWRIVLPTLRSFAGLMVTTHQYGYVALDEKQESLYISDFNIVDDSTNIYKTKIDDARIVTRFRRQGYFRDMLQDAKRGLLIATNFPGKEVCYYDDATAALIQCVPLGVKAVLNVAEFQDGGLVVTSEQGWVNVIGPDRKLLRQVRPPIFPEEMVLDKTERFLTIAAMAGYTISTMDLETMDLVKKRLVAFSSIGIAADPQRGRIFLPSLLSGDLLVLDEKSFDTLTRIPLDPGLRAVCFIPERNLIVVGNYFNGNLHIIDGSDYRLIRTIVVGSKTRSMRYSRVHDRLYVQSALRILEVDLNP